MPRPRARRERLRAPKVPSRPVLPVPKPPSRRGKSSDRALAGALGIFVEPEPSATLVDLVDNLLDKGVVLHADAILALADVDLVYLKLTALLAAADRVFGPRKVKG